MIESGEATVSVGGSSAPTLTAGDYFGEIALIDEGARTATITADQRPRLLRADLLGLPPARGAERAIGWKLLQSLVKRLRDAEAGQQA